MTESILDPIGAFLIFEIMGVPLWTIIGLGGAALLFPQVRTLFFKRVKDWALKRLGGGKPVGVVFAAMTMPALLIVSGCMLSGCSGLSKTLVDDDYVTATYKSLKSARVIYDEGMSAAAQLYRYGLLDEQDREKIIEAGDDFRVGWQAAVNALYAYATAEEASPGNEDLEKKLEMFGSAYATFSRLMQPYLIQALADASDDD